MSRGFWLPALSVVIALASPFVRSAGAELGTRGVWTSGASQWTVEGRGPTMLVELRLQPHTSGGDWNVSFPVPLDNLHGLSVEQLRAAQAAAHFELSRDAGTFSFDGSFASGDGAGHFGFAPSTEYVAALQGLGYAGLDASALLSLAVHDLSRAVIRELAGLGYSRLSLDELTSLGIHGATPAWIRELQALGYAKPSVDELVSMRIHGASPAFIKDLAALGYAHPSVDDLVSMRIHGASTDFVRELRALGYVGVSIDDLVSMRIHGVTPDFVRRVNQGGKTVSVERLVEMRIHGQEADLSR
jgi:hypothetical protein